MELKSKIKENINLFGLYDDLKPITLKHLIKIDEVLSKMVESQKDIVKTLKNNKITINGVSKESGISRQTFYNNPILSDYVDKYIEHYSISNPFETIGTLREELRRKESQILGLVKRDATISYYKAKNEELIEEIVSLKSTIKSQEKLIEINLRSKNQT